MLGWRVMVVLTFVPWRDLAVPEVYICGDRAAVDPEAEGTLLSGANGEPVGTFPGAEDTIEPSSFTGRPPTSRMKT
jgi:hypothetical protein